jgi:gamma-glutamylcyclotransferase (GGCT)/AIG2-like uncharacterized protein YtfP
MNQTTFQDKEAQGMLRIFVYGTPKRGFWNHSRFCRDALHIEDASVRGMLYELPTEIPVLHIPRIDILSIGTSEPLVDVVTQDRISGGLAANVLPDEEGWQMIQGELMTFLYPQLALPPIDRLEGFRPGYPSLYHRVLVPVMTKNCVLPAWCYIGAENVAGMISPTGKTVRP